jgi:hypothetical protein
MEAPHRVCHWRQYTIINHFNLSKLMKSKFFTLFAAFVLLFSANASAQVNGDVNDDGKVNEQDIAAILEIMAEAGGVKEPTKYYWYAGWTIPTAENIATIINEEYPVSSTNTTKNKAGGSTTVITGYTKNNPLYIYDNNRFNPGRKQFYLVLPNGIDVYESEGEASLLDTFILQENIVIPHHKVYISESGSSNISGLMLF